MHDATDRTINLGQYRLIRLQVINWGTFCDYKDFPIDERGVLFTGPSGAGKSTLLDAHSAVLLPVIDQQFNASADIRKRGAKKGTRNIANYVRGAWSETDDENDQSHVRRLRAGRPTWSAVGATYDNGQGSVTTAIVVKWFTGPEVDGKSLKSMHQIHDGHFDLRRLDEDWARPGFDIKHFKATYPEASYPRNHETYLTELGTRVGLGDSRTARSLLGKAKAMKDVGDLDLFVRDNMLDVPPTFDAANEMLETFKPLQDAYDRAHRAKRQADVLKDIPDNWNTYRAADTTNDLIDALLEGPAGNYLRAVHLDVLHRELETIDKIIDGLDRQLQEKQTTSHKEQQTYDSIDRQWKSQSQGLHQLETELQAEQAQVATRRQAHRAYGGLVAQLDLPCPQDQTEFHDLRNRLSEITEHLTTELNALKPQRQEAFARAHSLAQTLTAKSEELTMLQSAHTLIPPREDKRRQHIADAIGIPIADLPYAAELIDIARDSEAWRPAAEKVLRSFGLRLLVPSKYRDAVVQFIDDNSMRGIIEYSIFTPCEQPKRAEPGTFACKLDIDRGHPASAWLTDKIAKQFDHVCVRCPGFSGQ